MSRFVKIEFCFTFTICLLSIVLISVINGQDLLLKTGGKKGSIILMTKKCVPTLIKSGGKKSKDIFIIGNPKACEEHIAMPKYVPVPMYHQPQQIYQHKAPAYQNYGHYSMPMMSHSYGMNGYYSGDGGGYGGGHSDHYNGYSASGLGHMMMAGSDNIGHVHSTAGYSHLAGYGSIFNDAYGLGKKNYVSNRHSSSVY